MKLLCKLHFDTRRSGSIDEIFITTQEELDYVRGKNMYFSEELGKYSEFIVPVSDEVVTKLTDDQEFISKAIEYGLVGEEHRPWYRIPEETCESCGEWSMTWDQEKCPGCGADR